MLSMNKPVPTLVLAVVADLADTIADNLLVVDLGLSGDLTKDHDETCLGAGLWNIEKSQPLKQERSKEPKAGWTAYRKRPLTEDRHASKHRERSLTPGRRAYLQSDADREKLEKQSIQTRVTLVDTLASEQERDLFLAV